MHRHNESDRLRTPYDEASLLDLSPSDETIHFLYTVFSLHGGYSPSERVSKTLQESWFPTEKDL